jgi:murein DD-endopeptidase MepM/ murein hydrolase activator NlpD
VPVLPLRLQKAALVTAGFAALFVSTAGSAAAAGGWSAPLRPLTVTRAFQPPPNPYAAGHRGVDLAGVAGQIVMAAAAGEVSYAANLAGRGVVVVVHGNLRTTYEPVTATVRRGLHVERGEQLGTLDPGHAGCPVSACLHWGLLRGEHYLDPMTMLTRPQIRLLPPTGQFFAAAAASASAPNSTARPAATSAPDPPAPSPLAWSVAALAGGGMILALRRR